ncbi:hypothetical protein IscW_ISCW020220 [Ixodes scapularis]|uniref:Uncharacterized protein n=1 Tax=Ixodes scapularis TaxID=6945 RepID=B7Q3N8_IXOSC|nr:hypothetical protein IscW_ISCW020220 [Ixodes scapularis]|eukprot:XP_002411336.1 hypothetical protein IscW_ISCW020220 [Ixodes scapularis]
MRLPQSTLEGERCISKASQGGKRLLGLRASPGRGTVCLKAFAQSRSRAVALIGSNHYRFISGYILVYRLPTTLDALRRLTAFVRRENFRHTRSMAMWRRSGTSLPPCSSLCSCHSNNYGAEN